MISHLVLSKKDTLSDSVSLQIDKNNIEYIIIDHEKFDAAFTLHGAHLLHFQLKNQPPTIFLSQDAIFDNKKAIRGGVPICWPWFGPAGEALGENLPAHGFVRTSKWSLRNINELSNGVEIEFLFKDSEETLKLWPYKFELVLKATLTDTLKLELISKNTGDKAFPYRAALHTYLAISKPEECKITGLSPNYTDKLNADAQETSDGSLLINAPFDSIYDKSLTPITLNDSGYKRKLTMNNTGNDSEVLWSPWIEGAKAFADMPDNGYQNMVCIESTITSNNGQKIEIGQTHTLTTLISQNYF